MLPLHKYIYMSQWSVLFIHFVEVRQQRHIYIHVSLVSSLERRIEREDKKERGRWRERRIEREGNRK